MVGISIAVEDCIRLSYDSRFVSYLLSWTLTNLPVMAMLVDIKHIFSCDRLVLHVCS
jgi:hypothetical protein